MSQLEEHRRKEQFLRLPAIRSRVQRRPAVRHQHPLAIELPVEERVVAVFFLTPDTIPHTPLGTDAIEMSKTDRDTELFLERRLHFTAWHLWMCATGRNQPLMDGISQFGWMPLPFVLESSFSLCLYCLHQPIGCRSTHVESCRSNRLVPGITLLHEKNHQGFCLLVVFRFPLFQAVFPLFAAKRM